jgi:predicted component of type VI protein secretion system
MTRRSCTLLPFCSPGLPSLSIIMDSFIGPFDCTESSLQHAQQPTGQTLPPINGLGLAPRGVPLASEDPSHRPRARAQPYSQPANYLFDGHPVRTYYIEGLPYDMEAPTNEDHNTTFRQTFDGRTLKYTLTVLQQPERARACGAGARCEFRHRETTFPPSAVTNLAQLQPTAVQ